MRLMLLLASTAALAACEAGEPADGPATAPAEPAPVQAPAPEPAATLAWTAADDGSTLVLTDAGGGALIRLACPSGSGQLHVVGETLEEIGSEDRLTVGVGDEAFAMAADLEAPRTAGVEASGAMDADLLDRIEAGGEISLSYGAQTVGPAPGPEDATAFVAACRAEL